MQTSIGSSCTMTSSRRPEQIRDSCFTPWGGMRATVYVEMSIALQAHKMRKQKQSYGRADSEPQNKLVALDKDEAIKRKLRLLTSNVQTLKCVSEMASFSCREMEDSVFLCCISGRLRKKISTRKASLEMRLEDGEEEGSSLSPA